MKGLSEIVTLAWNIAGAEAISANFEFIEREHFFISLTEIRKLLALTAPKLNFSPEQTAAAEAEFQGIEALFSKFNLNLTKLRRAVRDKLGEGRYSGRRGDIHRSEESRALLVRARAIAGLRRVTGFDLLRAIMENPGPVITEALAECSVTPAQLAQAIMDFNLPEQPSQEPARRKVYTAPEGLGAIIGRGRDLMALASQGSLSAVVGRESEITRLLSILWIGQGKIPVLVGPAGVGKSALVETLAMRIWDGRAPGRIAARTIIEADTGALLEKKAEPADFRKALEDTIGPLRGRKDITLYLDRLPQLLEADAECARLEAAPELLRTALLKNELRLIASSDAQAYAALAAGDARFAQNFQSIEVPEPTPEQTLEILREWKSRLEIAHGVKITDGAAGAVLELSEKYSLEGCYPRKALAVLEGACGYFKKAVENPHGGIALSLEAAARKIGFHRTWEVDELCVAQALSERLALPLDSLAGQLGIAVSARIAGLERLLRDNSSAQPEAADRIFKLLSARLSARGAAQAPCVLMFLSPRGAGEEEIARRIAEGFFGSQDDLFSVDMVQYSREEGIKRLFNSEYSGIVTEHLKLKPCSVVLFQNTDQTPPLFFVEFRNFVAGADRRDKAGGGLPLANTIFILTSAMFSKPKDTAKKVFDYATASREMARRLQSYLPKSVMEIITDTVVFKPLTEQMALRVLVGWIEQARQSVREKHGVEIHVSREVERLLLEEGYSSELGIRQLRIKYDELFCTPLQNTIDRKEISRYPEWNMKVSNGEVTLTARPITQVMDIEDTA